MMTVMTHHSNATAERRAAHAVQRKVDCVVGCRQRVGDLHRQIDLGVQRGVVMFHVRPQRRLVGVDQIQDGVGQLKADRGTADGHQHYGQLTLRRLVATRSCR